LRIAGTASSAPLLIVLEKHDSITGHTLKLPFLIAFLTKNGAILLKLGGFLTIYVMEALMRIPLLMWLMN
jgi:hypothetical protein